MRTYKAFTLAELVMGLSVLAIIGLAVAGVSRALSDGYAASEGYGDALQSGRSSLMRVEATARKARLITAWSSGCVVFWACDTNGDGQINLDELTTITYSSTAKEIRVVRVDFTGVSNAGALNVIVPLASVTTVSGATAVQNADTHCTSNVLASDVKDCRMTVSPAAPMATQVNLQLTLGSGERPITLSGSTRLRADSTSHVGTSGGNWVLVP